MAHIASIVGAACDPLREGWQLCATAAEAYSSPGELPEGLDWVRASVPGTVATALLECKRWSIERPTSLHDKDFWYCKRFAGTGAATLRFEGLATIAKVWLNGLCILRSNNMFLAHDVDVRLIGDNELYI